MTTNKPKMKGIFKGFKYISQIFEEEKDDEIQIGLPTDVKHVAHIGWDGPAVETPSWMKEFSSSPGLHSAPLGPPADGEKEEPEVKWVSEDANTKRSSGNGADSSTSRDLPDVPRSSRRNGEGGDSSPKRRDPNKVKQRKTHSKELSEGDPTKKSRRKKSREMNSGGQTRPRSKDNGNDSESSFDPVPTA